MEDGRRVPPNNLEAERACLGAILLDPDALERVVPHILAEDFYRPAHAAIYRAVTELSERGEAIDIITVTDALRASDGLSRAGGASYVSSLTSDVPTSANVEFYARIVRDASVRRRLISIAGTIAESAGDQSREAEAILEDAERRIFDINEERTTDTYHSAGEVLGETIRALERIYQNRDTYTGIPSGFPDLDNMLSGFQNSEFIVIGARPSLGKTALALSIAANISIRHKRSVGFFTLEMSNMALMQRLLSMEARVPANMLKTGTLSMKDWHRIGDAAGVIYEAPLYIADIPNMRLLDLRGRARRMRKHHGVEIIFIDYLTLITTDRGDTPRHEQVAEISRSLKALARELEIPVVALSQVTRDSEGRVPSLASIRESGSIEQDADAVLFIHRERVSDHAEGGGPAVVETELIVAKQRNGPIGTIQLAFLPQFTRFESLSRQSHG